VETPCFMPVGTRATVTGLTAADLRALGAQIILGNTYHLLLRPGPEARALGGIHRFMAWDGPVLTDSGGFQIFSLAGDRSLCEEGASFESYLDRRRHLLSPESSIAMQHALGSDVERELGAVELAVSDEGAAALRFSSAEVAALRALAARGVHEEERIRWSLVRGDLPETLALAPAEADLVFWDPFSPRADPALWSCSTFASLRQRCGPAAALYTYSTATSVRAALLLAGFFVGAGAGSGQKRETTAAATRPSLLSSPLGARWLLRVSRSAAPLPPDAPPDALARLRAHPQFS